MKYFILSLLLLVSAATLGAQSPIGIWKTVDDETGREKSHLEIYEKNGKLHGKVIKLLDKPADTKCEKCPGEMKGQPVLGMIVLANLTPKDGHWKNGSIMDPTKGAVYSCSIWFENGDASKLKVRGKHWSGIYRTQTWYRL